MQTDQDENQEESEDEEYRDDTEMNNWFLLLYIFNI